MIKNLMIVYEKRQEKIPQALRNIDTRKEKIHGHYLK